MCSLAFLAELICFEYLEFSWMYAYPNVSFVVNYCFPPSSSLLSFFFLETATGTVQYKTTLGNTYQCCKNSSDST